MLPPGDYRIRLVAFCTRGGGVQRIDTSAKPRWHEQFLVGPLRGQRAALLRALYSRAAVNHVAYRPTQSLSWGITGGLRYEQLATEQRTLFDRLVPEYRSAMAFDQFDALQSKWDSFRPAIPGLPSFDASIDGLGDLGKTIRRLQALRRTVIETSGNFDAQMRQLAPIVQPPADGVQPPAMWSIVSDHELARVLVPSNFYGIGHPFVLEVRLLANPRAAAMLHFRAANSAEPVQIESPFALFYPPSTGAQPITATVEPDGGQNDVPPPPQTPAPMPSFTFAPSPSPSPTCVRFAGEIARAARRYGVDPSLLAAIAAQETGGPKSDDGRNVIGDHGHGHGVFQIDDRWHAFARSKDAMDPEKNALYAAQLIRDYLKQNNGDVHAALSQYNSGDPDGTGTTTTWPGGQVLSYADSVLRHQAQLKADNRQTDCTGAQ
jgi:hypothetical protein